ncbi:MAG: hypothetical protein IJE09_08835 [Oscillospiraceae bacterium]|nr:hypothetical protein [Oscillospiraceae bacterium]
MDYKYLYHLLFNAATDAINFINDGRYDLAELQLILAQRKAEDEYIKMSENEEL